jgi:hypothetical protein
MKFLSSERNQYEQLQSNIQLGSNLIKDLRLYKIILITCILFIVMTDQAQAIKLSM